MRKLRSVVILSTIFVVMLVAFSTQAFAQVAAEPIPKPSNFNGKIIETAKYATIQIEVFKGTDVEVYVVNKSNSKYSYSKHFTYDAKYKIQLYPGKNVVKIKTYYKKTLKTYAATYEYVVSPQKEKLTPAAPLIKTTDKNKLVVDGSFDYVSLRFKVYEGTYAKVQVRNSADTATVETATIEPSENEGVALKAGKHKVILETFSKATKKRVESRPQTFIYNVTNKATSSSGGNKEIKDDKTTVKVTEAPKNYRTGALNINGGQKTSLSRNVVLRLSFSSSYAYMKVSENKSFSGANWVAAQKNINYKISSKGGGPKVIYVQFMTKDKKSVSAVYGDQIFLVE